MKKVAVLLAIASIFNFSLFAQETGGPYTTDNNTVLLMHFEGDATNSSGVGNNGIEHGSGVSYETGIHGSCLRLDNSTADKQSWIEVPFYDELNFTDEFSIECWFKVNSLGGDNQTKYPFIIKKGENELSDYDIWLNHEIKSLNADLNCIDDDYSRAAYLHTADTIVNNKWYHIAVYFNYSHQHFYMILRDENYKEIYADRFYTYTKPFNSDDKLFIGFGNDIENYFDGWIDELRISNCYRKYRDDIVTNIDIPSLKDSVAPLLRDKWQVYQWPLSEFYPVSSENGERGGNACGHTAILRLIHYWEYPRFPKGNLDYFESGFHWVADFNNTEYRFDEMPDIFPRSTTEEDYESAATLSVQIGAIVRLQHKRMGSYSSVVQNIMKEYFLYDHKLKMIYREEYTKEEWEKIFKYELTNKRPILIGGVAERYENGNCGGHYYICDGYNSANQFHSDMSKGENWWTDIDEFEFGQNQDVLIFAEPDWQGKTLSLVYPEGGEYYTQKNEITIKWSSSNIQNVLLEYSTDAGKNWHTIVENIEASEDTYTWNIPDTVSTEYKIRISDSSDGNIYKRCETFTVYDQKQFSFVYPVNTNELKSGRNHPIYWQSEGIQAFKLEYSTGDDSWQLLCDSINAASGVYSCEIPNLNANKLIFKASDILESHLFFVSDTIQLKNKNRIGDVTNADGKTVLLMHFEENLKNEANNKLTVSEGFMGRYINNFDLNLGKGYRINNETNVNTFLNVSNSKNVDLGTNWTIETWVNINSIGDEHTAYYPVIIVKEEVFGIFLNSNYSESISGFRIFLNYANGTNLTFYKNQTLDLNTWYHISLVSDSASQSINFFVRDENRNLIYEDARPFPEGSNGILLQYQNDFEIGGDGNWNRYFDGFIDEMKITKSSKLHDYSSADGTITSSKIIINADNNLKIYPNPITYESIISFQTKTKENINLSIFDLQGRKIRTLINDELLQGSHSYSIGKYLVENGVYLCRLTTEKGTSTIKLVKNN